jgi:hypothetical protein
MKSGGSFSALRSSSVDYSDPIYLNHPSTPQPANCRSYLQPILGFFAASAEGGIHFVQGPSGRLLQTQRCRKKSSSPNRFKLFKRHNFSIFVLRMKLYIFIFWA